MPWLMWLFEVSIHSSYFVKVNIVIFVPLASLDEEHTSQANVGIYNLGFVASVTLDHPPPLSFRKQPS